jgi:hypothetical protein
MTANISTSSGFTSVSFTTLDSAHIRWLLPNDLREGEDLTLPTLQLLPNTNIRLRHPRQSTNPWLNIPIQFQRCVATVCQQSSVIGNLVLRLLVREL